MDVVRVVLVVEVNGRDNMELSMEDIKENIQDIVDGTHKFLSNLVAMIGFGVEMANLPKERVSSNYFELDVDKIEILT